MIKNGKYYTPPPKEIGSFHDLFLYLTSAGVGRTVSKDGIPKGPWTAELLADAISEIEFNKKGVETRTVQLWFENNNKGPSPDNIHWLARITGCDDPIATSEWQVALRTTKASVKRNPTFRNETFIVSPAKNTVVEKNSIQHQRFNLSKATQVLFDNHSFLSLWIIVFSAAIALALISVNLNIHSVTITQTSGFEKQVGFLWAPNWTFVFLLLLETSA